MSSRATTPSTSNPGVVWDWRVRGPQAPSTAGIHVSDLCDLPHRTRLALLAELMDEIAAAAHRHYALTFTGRTAAHRQVAAVQAVRTDPAGVTATRRATLDAAVNGWRLAGRAKHHDREAS